MHTSSYKMHICETHTREMRAHEMCTCEMRTCEMHACEMDACEMHAWKTHAWKTHAWKTHAWKTHAWKTHAWKMHAWKMHAWKMVNAIKHPLYHPDGTAGVLAVYASDVFSLTAHSSIYVAASRLQFQTAVYLRACQTVLSARLLGAA
jgi:hypothetical protein